MTLCYCEKLPWTAINQWFTNHSSRMLLSNVFTIEPAHNNSISISYITLDLLRMVKTKGMSCKRNNLAYFKLIINEINHDTSYFFKLLTVPLLNKIVKFIIINSHWNLLYCIHIIHLYQSSIQDVFLIFSCHQ